MTYREAIPIIFWLLAVLVFLRLMLWLSGVLLTGKPRRVPSERAVVYKTVPTPAQPVPATYEAPAAAQMVDAVIRNVEVLTDDELTRPRMGYRWHVVPSDPALRDLAIDRLERGWKYAHADGIFMRGMRYMATKLPSVPPTSRPRGY